MNKILVSLLFMITAIAAQAQKVINDPNAEKRTVSGFHGVEVGGGIDIFLSQGSEAVAVSASDKEYRDRIKTEVVNGILKIRYENIKGSKNWSTGKMKLKVYVSFKELNSLHVSGGSDATVEGTIKSEKLDLEVSGGSDFNGKVNATTLRANVSGGSDLKISGSATTLDIVASGGSDFSGYDLTVATCNADASGGSDIFITATKELSVQSSGGSDIHYKGGAVIRNINSSGGGNVKKVS